jgi:hypothetical protein
MYGKHFKSMYSGSMVGSGAIIYAVWGYVIANCIPDRKVGTQVELNPVLLAAILGEKVEAVEKAVEFLCSPDPRSRTKIQEGRRLVRLAEFDYKVVNGVKYREIRDEEARREQNRRAQEKWRGKPKPLKGEIPGAKAYDNGNDAEGDRLAALRETPKPWSATTEKGVTTPA